MMKSEKLRDFKTQEQQIQVVWNTGIYNIGIVVRSCLGLPHRKRKPEVWIDVSFPMKV